MLVKWFCFSLIIFLGGCTQNTAIPSIVAESTPLEEENFRIVLPKDWKIVNQVDNSDQQQEISTYYFRHPQNRKCYVSVEITEWPKVSKISDVQLERTIACIIRLLQDTLEQNGYKDFTFKTLPTTFSQQAATKITATTFNKDARRESLSILLTSQNKIYAVSYHWFSRWGEETKKRLKEIVYSFKFLRNNQ